LQAAGGIACLSRLCCCEGGAAAAESASSALRAIAVEADGKVRMHEPGT